VRRAILRLPEDTQGSAHQSARAAQLHLEVAQGWRDKGMPFEQVLGETCVSLSRAHAYWSRQAEEAQK
jgi:hypothetical protein